MRAIAAVALAAGCVTPNRVIPGQIGAVVTGPVGEPATTAERVAGATIVRTFRPRSCRWLISDLAQYGDAIHGEHEMAKAGGAVVVPCPVPAARYPITGTLASGVRFEAVSDSRGVLVVLGNDGTTVDTHAAAPPPPPPPADVGPAPSDHGEGFPAVHDAANRCANLDGVVTIKLVVDPDGHVASSSVDRGDAQFVACLSHALAGVRFPAHNERQFLTVAFKLTPRS